MYKLKPDVGSIQSCCVDLKKGARRTPLVMYLWFMRMKWNIWCTEAFRKILSCTFFLSCNLNYTQLWSSCSQACAPTNVFLFKFTLTSWQSFMCIYMQSLKNILEKRSPSLTASSRSGWDRPWKGVYYWFTNNLRTQRNWFSIEK